MITQKQKRLALELFQSLKAKFPEIELIGDRKIRFNNIHQAIGNLIRSQNAGRMGVMSAGTPGPLVMFCHLKNLDFARRKIAGLLDKQTVPDEAIIHWNPPGSLEKMLLYPPSGDGIA